MYCPASCTGWCEMLTVKVNAVSSDSVGGWNRQEVKEDEEVHFPLSLQQLELQLLSMGAMQGLFTPAS